MSVLELRESIERGLKSKSAALMAFDFHIDPFFLAKHASRVQTLHSLQPLRGSSDGGRPASG